MSDPVRDRIRAHVGSRVPRVVIGDDQPVLTGGVDPVFAVELVRFLETAFELRIPDSELRLDNFRTIDAMCALVDRVAAQATRT
ncbi:acyl carrier protein [Streptomyces sp. NPDC005017]|uniref:acyl carrier protein n=1 Tax=Streptomyces sp. NPDC005017 TaxID=3364706 RepID=UPI0036A5DE24